MTVNADPAELQKFSDNAHHWWDESSEFAPLHAINPLRMQWIEQHVTLAQKKVLDVGCGGGILTEALAKAGAQVSGIDLSDNALRIAKLHLYESELTIDYQHCSAEAFAEQHPGHFDVITCMEMLEHVPDPASIVRACATLVKPNGYVFFSTINRNPKAYLLAVLGAEYVLNLIPKGTHDYQKFIKPSELRRYCTQTGLEAQAITGLHYNPLLKSYDLGSGADVNYLLRTQRPATSETIGHSSTA